MKGVEPVAAAPAHPLLGCEAAQEMADSIDEERTADNLAERSVQISMTHVQCPSSHLSC